MTYIPASLRARVAARAQESCEYGLIHADYAAFKHEIDHVIAIKHEGATEEDNLAYACAQCNRFKGSNIAALDPRKQQWPEHCQLDGPVIVPLSASGRATERLLELNQIDRVLLRQELSAAWRYPGRSAAAAH